MPDEKEEPDNRFPTIDTKPFTNVTPEMVKMMQEAAEELLPMVEDLQRQLDDLLESKLDDLHKSKKEEINKE